MNITEKSTGQLVDELITNAFKTHFALSGGKDGSEYESRYGLLRDALKQHLGEDVAGLIHDLAIVLMATWQAQEVLMHEKDDALAATAGRQAQRANAQRSQLVREIDRLLGEAEITITTKTYG